MSSAVAPHIVNPEAYKQSLRNMNPTEVTYLPNGMTVASEYIDGPTATVGMWIDAGSRWETEVNNGTAHFLEHLVFKGTENRTQHQLEIEVENMGAHLNAYTSREQTVYYAKCLARDTDRSMDILADILRNPRLDEGAIERERHVILREMQEVETNLQEVVFDHLHAIAFQGTPLSYNILGPTQNIKSINRADLQDYITTHYTAGNIVLAAAGGVEHGELVKLAERYFGDMPANNDHRNIHGMKPGRYSGSLMTERNDDMDQVHLAIAVEGCSWTNPDYFPLMIANTIIGNWNKAQGGGRNIPNTFAKKMNKAGCQSFMAFNTCYKDTGLWGVYGITDTSHHEQFIAKTQSEMIRIAKEVTAGELRRAKNLLKTQMLAQLDGSTAICEDIGRQMLTYGRRIPLPEIDARIEAVDSVMLRKVVDHYVYDRDPVVVGVGHCEYFVDYNVIRMTQSNPLD